jgi:hypothetical protein
MQASVTLAFLPSFAFEVNYSLSLSWLQITLALMNGVKDLFSENINFCIGVLLNAHLVADTLLFLEDMK